MLIERIHAILMIAQEYNVTFEEAEKIYEENL